MTAAEPRRPTPPDGEAPPAEPVEIVRVAKVVTPPPPSTWETVEAQTA